MKRRKRTVTKALGDPRPLPATNAMSSAPPRADGDAKPSPKSIVGTAGTAVFGGFLSSPELSSDLVGQTKFKTYENFILNCDIVATAVRYVNTLVKGTQWRVDPAADGGTEAQNVADAITSILLAPRAMARPWNKVVARQAQSEWKGFAVSEWIAKVRDDGLIGIADIQPRPQQTIWRWDIQTDGTVMGFWQLSPWTFQELYLPRAKCIYTVDGDITDSPDGTGRLRHVAETARQLKRLEQIEGWGFELDLSGVPIARVPYAEMNKMVEEQKITEAQKQSFVQGAKDFISNHVITPGRGLVMESMMYPNSDNSPSSSPLFDLEVIQSQVSGLVPINTTIERKIRQIARILGIEGLLLGGDGKGSLALSKDKSMQLAQQVSSMLDDLSWAFDHDLIAVLMALNGWDPRLVPTLTPSAIQLRDVEYIVDALTGIAQAALPPDDEAIDSIRDMVGLPHAPKAAPATAALIKPTQPAPSPDLGEPDDDDDLPDDQTTKRRRRR